MEGPTHIRATRGRGGAGGDRPRSRNKHWVPGEASISAATSTSRGHADGERWERGGHRGRGARGVVRGVAAGPPRKFPNVSLRIAHTNAKGKERAAEEDDQVMQDAEEGHEEDGHGEEEEEEEEEHDELADIEGHIIDEPELETQEERERFYQELVKSRELERKRAIAEGKMDDPLVPKRLEDAISMVGTCLDMCPRFERYRRERENNLFEWETIPGTKRVNHRRAVKMYERAAGDKTLPSDLRPPHVLKRTLDYLFHDLLLRGGFSATFNFIRDRSRAVRNDFTMQHNTGPLAIECHDRCARFHIMALHLERDRTGFSIALEEQQLMNTLQSLKEFYEDQRTRYTSPTELEMRVYHRLIHIRDQKERAEDIPASITAHPVFRLTTDFRQHVQRRSAPITKTSALVVDAEGMRIFGELAGAMRAMKGGGGVMVYLVACILERLFGKDTIEDIEALRGGLTLGEVIDGVEGEGVAKIEEVGEEEGEEEGGQEEEDEMGEYLQDEQHEEEAAAPFAAPVPVERSATQWLDVNFSTTSSTTSAAPPPPPPPAAASAFGNLTATPSVFGGQSVFGGKSVFGGGQSVFGGGAFGGSASSSSPGSVFGGAGQGSKSVFGQPASSSNPPATEAAALAPHTNGISSSTTTSPFASTSTTAQTGGSAHPSPFGTPPSGSYFSNLNGKAGAEGAKAEGATKPLFGVTPVTFGNGGLKTSASSASGGLGAVPLGSTRFAGEGVTGFVGAASGLTGFAGAASGSTGFLGTPGSTGGLVTSGSTDFPSSGSFGLTTSGSTTALATPGSSAQGAPSGSSTSFKALPPLNPQVAPFTPPSTLLSNGIGKPTHDGGAASAPPVLTFTPPPALTFTPPPAAPSFPSPSAAPSFTPPPHLTRTTSSSRSSGTPPLTIDTTAPRRHGPSPIPSSPAVPPPLQKPHPISLPGTPTLGAPPPNLTLGFPPRTLSRTNTEILSPLVLASPGASGLFVNNFTPRGTPMGMKRFRSDASLPKIEPMQQLSSGHGKGKAPISEAEMDAQALEFERRGGAVKTCFRQWLQKAMDRAAWVEACRHSDAYRQKIRGEGRSPFTIEKDKKKRRVSDTGATANGFPVKKRARKRVSDYQPPRTDEELARRFKENHEEHERRWAQGSFLQVARTHVKGKLKASPAVTWCLWLSMNPDSDATAIWLEKKFDVPSSGEWVSEAIFSIPVAVRKGATAQGGYPGVIVFECTPIEDVADEIERKYRILDDCSRLRDIITSLPPKRHFIPSLLIFCWTDGKNTDASSDFFDMVKKFTEDKTLQRYLVLPMSSATTELDAKLEEALTALPLDTEGRLVQCVTIRGIFKIFEPTFTSFVAEWLENCSLNGYFNWSLYGQLMQASVALLNKLAQCALSLLGERAADLLPSFDLVHLQDSESAYELAAEWLNSASQGGDTEGIVNDLRSHNNMAQDFPTRIFIDHLAELLQSRLGRHVEKDLKTQYYLTNADVNSSTEAFKAAIQPHQIKLGQTLNLSVRRSPKRRGFSVETDDTSPGAKRMRMTESVASTIDDRTPPSSPLLNGHNTPSPSVSTMSVAPSEPPQVTVAMLRALTRDMKKKYVPGT